MMPWSFNRDTAAGMTSGGSFGGWSLFRGTLKMTALVLLILAIIPCQCLLLPWRSLGWRAARFWHQSLCRVLGIAVECVGKPLTGMQVAYVGNHLSYLDIPVVGSVVLGRFVAKADMQHWPLFGLLARLQRTVFISRRSRDAVNAVRAMDAALQRGDSLILFPEGTSSAGEWVCAFKSSAFSAPAAHLARGLVIQPFSMTLQTVDGREPRTILDRNRYAYYADMQLAGHLWRFMRTRGARVRLIFHPALAAAEGSDRKHIAATAASVVASGLNAVRSPSGDGGSTLSRASQRVESAP